MRRGTRVGQAYIALTADGSGMNDDIADSLDDVDYDGLGDRHGQEYSDRFKSHIDGMSESFSVFLRDLGKSIDTDDQLTQGIRRQVNDAFTGGDLDSLTAGIGRRLGLSLGSEMQPEIEKAVRNSVNDSLQKLGRDSNFDLSGFIRSIDSGAGSISIIGPIMDRAETEARTSMERQAREMISVHGEALVENANQDRAAVAERQRMYEDMFRTIDDREARSSAIYQTLLDGEAAALERSLADRAQMEDDDARRSQRTRDQREQMYASMFTQIDDREAESSRIYQALLDGEADATARSLADRAQMEEDHNRRRTQDQERYAADFARLLDEQDARQARSLRGRIAAQRATRADNGGVGNLFGEGSRNNFLNFVGKSIGNTVGLVQRAQSALTGLFSTFQTGFQGAAEGANTFTRTGAGMSAVLTEIGATAIVSLPAIAIGAVVAIAAMSVLVSVASALLALLVAMAATITSALVGALLVGAGALGAIAVAAGLATVAFTSLTDAQKASLKADFAPLKQELTGLGQLMLTELIPYFSTWSDNLQVALYQLTPLASVFGDALGRAGDSLTASLAGPGFAMLTQQLGILLPGIITRLSLALGNFLNGIAGTFSAILPDVSRFASYLVDVTARFSTFANSAEGQNKIQDFLNRAVDSLISFSGFVREATGFVADLLFSADSQNAGNNIFDSLRDSFAGFRENLKGDDLKNWFERALDFGGDVKDLIISIKNAIKKLDSDGTLEKVSGAIKGLADALQDLVDIASTATDIFEFMWNAMLNPAALGSSIFSKVGEQLDALSGKADGVIGKVTMISAGGFADIAAGKIPQTGSPISSAPVQGPGISTSGQTQISTTLPTQSALTQAGLDALNKTSQDSGGYKPDPVKKTPKYKNPYVEFANSLLASAPTVAAKIRASMKALNQTASKAIDDASKSTDSGSVTSSLDSMADSMKESGKNAVSAAQDALNSAASSLANASSAKAAKQALKNVKASQKELKKTIEAQARINAAAAIVNGQKVLSESNVQALLTGVQVQNATLADYAEARSRLAVTLSAANEKLTAAIAMRDQYNTSVMDAVKSFGSILSAQAKSINGVQQALTATDITTNLQARLDQIRKFQSDLNILLSQGLSNDAYKQLVDAGVETGGAYAAALVQGGPGSVQLTNDLTEQISQVATSLGGQASNRLYQAGVDAAQGLVDGLTSMSAQLDSAAARLGDSIAAAVKRALGIASPSKVMKGVTRNVGQTLITGLGDEETGVERAANALSSRIKIQPSAEVARYDAEQRQDGGAVSENQGEKVERHDHWHIETPTTDPLGVAREAINEMTGRIG